MQTSRNGSTERESLIKSLGMNLPTIGLGVAVGFVAIRGGDITEMNIILFSAPVLISILAYCYLTLLRFKPLASIKGFVWRASRDGVW